ncbi:hypothetical protein SNEBB_005480 [Seison nebaliae]|nr:hypothetical protein SNEBB_005480 [Seison nebaliae]
MGALTELTNNNKTAVIIVTGIISLTAFVALIFLIVLTVLNRRSEERRREAVDKIMDRLTTGQRPSRGLTANSTTKDYEYYIKYRKAFPFTIPADVEYQFDETTKTGYVRYPGKEWKVDKDNFHLYALNPYRAPKDYWMNMYFRNIELVEVNQNNHNNWKMYMSGSRGGGMNDTSIYEQRKKMNEKMKYLSDLQYFLNKKSNDLFQGKITSSTVSAPSISTDSSLKTLTPGMSMNVVRGHFSSTISNIVTKKSKMKNRSSSSSQRT